METKPLAVIVTIGFSCLGVLGDYFLKLASDEAAPLRSRWFYIGFALYASTAFGWAFVMQHLKLATIGVVYSVSMILLLTSIGVVFFRESLNYSVLSLKTCAYSLGSAANRLGPLLAEAGEPLAAVREGSAHQGRGRHSPSTTALSLTPPTAG